MIHPASFIPRLTLLAGCLLVSACALEFSGWLPPLGWLPFCPQPGQALVSSLPQGLREDWPGRARFPARQQELELDSP